jgi:hypothetical protein
MNPSAVRISGGGAREVAGEIHRAMEEAHGDTALAAQNLGITKQQLWGLIHKNEELKNRWGNHHFKPTEKTEAVTLHRPILTPAELEEAKAIRREDKLVERGLEKCGISGGKLSMAMALQQFHRAHFRTAIDLIGGGMVVQYLGMLDMVNRIEEELANKPDLPREAMLREHHTRLLDLIPKYFDRANQATLTQAKVRALKNASQGGKPGPTKPGFSPLINVQPGGNVTITDGQPKPTT